MVKNKLAPVRREPTTLISGRSKHRAFKNIEFETSPNSVAATHVTPAPCLDESEPACPSDSNSYLPIQTLSNFQRNLWSFRSSDWVSTTGASWHQVDTMADTGSFGCKKYQERRCKRATVFLHPLFENQSWKYFGACVPNVKSFQDACVLFLLNSS